MDPLARLLNITNALADESRLRALLALRRGELCVCQITALLGLAPSTVSRHISLLQQAGLVQTRKNGRWVFYRLAEMSADPLVADSIEWACRHAADSPTATNDRRSLELILKQDPEELCRRQTGKSKSCSSARGTRAVARWRKAGPGLSRAT